MRKARSLIVAVALLFLLSSCQPYFCGYVFRNHSSYEVWVDWYTTMICPESGFFKLAPGATWSKGTSIKGNFGFNFGPENYVRCEDSEESDATIYTFVNR